MDGNQLEEVSRFIGEVITLLGKTNKGVARSLSKSILALYASVIEMERIQKKHDSHYSWSFEEGIVKLRMRRDALQLAHRGFR